MVKRKNNNEAVINDKQAGSKGNGQTQILITAYLGVLDSLGIQRPTHRRE